MTIEKCGIRERCAGRFRGYAAVAAMAVSVFVDAQAALTSKSYIQDGLLAHWDAIENAGYGQHDDTTNVWTDLKGFADLTVVNSNSTWTADAFVPPQKDYYSAARDEAYKIKVTAYRTIDACVTRRVASDVLAILGQNARTVSWQSKGFICRNTTTMTCHADLVANTPYTICAAYESGSSSSVLANYLDGVAVEETNETHTALSVGSKFQIGRDVNEYWSSKAPVHSVRLYSRVLEPWEIQVNSNVDQIRYRGADGATLTWPDGFAFVDDSVCYRTTATTKTYSSFESAVNKIRVNDGEPSAAPTAWKPVEGTYVP